VRWPLQFERIEAGTPTLRADGGLSSTIGTVIGLVMSAISRHGLPSDHGTRRGAASMRMIRGLFRLSDVSVRLCLGRLITFRTWGTALGWEHRFCGRCGRELRPAARFCGTCGAPVPESADQGAARDGVPDPPAGRRAGSYQSGVVPTITAAPVPAHGTPPGPRRRPTSHWPLAVVVALLLAGGGTGAVFLLRHSQPGSQPNLATQASSHAPAETATTTSPSPTSPSPTSPSPAPPPTQVTLNGMTIRISAVNTDPNATGVAATFAAYFSGIDSRNYMQAWDTYTPALQAAIPFQSWSSGLGTTHDGQVAVQSIQHDPNGDMTARVTFQSHQAGQYGPNPGETCTDWSLDYQLVPSSAGSSSLSYLINEVATVGAGHASC
jgi:hypothetical protein